MSVTAEAPNCIDIIEPFLSALDADCSLPRVQVMGGIASAALQHPGTEIMVGERRIVTPRDFLEDEAVQEALAPTRIGGSKRDIDALILSSDPEQIDDVKQLAEDTIGDRLDRKLFHIHDFAEVEERVDSLFGLPTLKTFVSDRYRHRDGRLLKALSPLFAVEMPPETLEFYTVEIGDMTMPTANPAQLILNYWTRSMSGLRPKDAEKVERLAGHVFAKAPELVDWAYEGPGESQLKLAAMLHTLRWANSLSPSRRELVLGGALRVKAGSVRRLVRDEAFLLGDVNPNTRDAALLLAIVKSRGLGMGESAEPVVDFFQQHIEPRIDSITNNE
ncbi:MAG TPA: hypothetical protein VII55_03455 [Candidatus Saccharimonadales bacterium]